MANEENRSVNEVVLNGTTIISTREDSVAEDNLVMDETATNKAGEKIKGELDVASADETYNINDPVDDIADEDYIPFNDVSDSEMPKKKTLFSSFIEKLTKYFLPASSIGGKSQLKFNDSGVLDLQLNDIDASKTNNNVTSIHYPTTSNVLDKARRIIMRTEAVVNPDGNIGWKAYVRNYNTSGEQVGQKGMQFHMGKSGNLSYQVDDARAFREAIGTMDVIGTSLPSGTVIDDYHTSSHTGVYYFADDGVAGNITTLPEAICGKLIVTNNGNGGFTQYYLPNHSVKLWVRVWWSNAWSAWVDVVHNHTYNSGIEIPANADLNSYTTEGVYQCALDATARTMSNLPYTGNDRVAFKLIVMNGRASTIKTQIYIPAGMGDNRALYQMAYRAYNGSNWKSWHCIANTDSVHFLYEPDLAHQISANQDLNDYTESGTYQCNNANIAVTLSNCPVNCSFKLVVDRAYVGSASEIMQRITMQNSESAPQEWVRVRQYSATTWGEWKRYASFADISPSQIGNGYAVGTVSGSAITATITGFKLRAGVIVAIKIEREMTTACTLNINNTGAKNIKYWNNQDPTYGKSLVYGGIFTFIYDGTYYRVLSFDRTPFVGVQDYVADTSGSILLDWGYDVNRAQLKYNLYDNKLKWNYYKNSAWRGDKQIVDVEGGQTMEGWLGLKVSGGRTIASGAHSLAIMDTIPNIINELRYSNGAWGSFNLGTAYTKDYTTIPAGWYNYFYFPHRVGGENWAKPTSWDADNVNYGTLMLFGMNNTYGMFRIRWQIESGAITIKELEDLQKGNCYVGTCATAADQQNKVATVDGNFILRKGVRIAIKFSNSNTYNSTTSAPVTLNVNGTGAKNIWYGGNHSGAANTGTMTWVYGSANQYFKYVYDGTYWVWEGCGVDNNSTNFLRNDTSTTLTANGAPYINVKSSTIDITQDNNGVESTQYPAYIIQDKNGKDMSRLETLVETNGRIATYLQVRNYKTSDGTNPNGGIRIYMDKSSNVTYWLSNPHKFNAATGIGYGTCSTAADQRVKAVTLANFVLVVGGIIGVKFTNTNTYNATADNKVCLNVNGTGEKPIYYNTGYPTGTNTTAFGIANRVHYYMYDGTNWCWLNSGCEDNTTDPRALGFGYGTCETAESTTAKVVTLSSYTMRTGGYVTVWFKEKVPANATMNINSKGAKPIYYRGSAIGINQIKAGDRATFIYDGTNYQLVGVDRDNYLKINYRYADSAGTPSSSYITNLVSELKITEMTYVVEGDMVNLGFCFVWSASKTYSSTTALFKLNYAGRQVIYWTTNKGTPYGYLNSDGNFYIRTLTVNSGNYYVQMSFIKAGA